MIYGKRPLEICVKICCSEYAAPEICPVLSCAMNNTFSSSNSGVLARCLTTISDASSSSSSRAFAYCTQTRRQNSAKWRTVARHPFGRGRLVGECRVVSVKLKASVAPNLSPSLGLPLSVSQGHRRRRRSQWSFCQFRSGLFVDLCLRNPRRHQQGR